MRGDDGKKNGDDDDDHLLATQFQSFCLDRTRVPSSPRLSIKFA
jgi:hypothetical protein